MLPRIAFTRILTATALVVAFVLGRMSAPRTSEAANADGRAAVAAREAPTDSAPRISAGAGAAKPPYLRAAIDAVHRAPDRATRLYEFSLRLHETKAADFPALFRALLTTRTPESPELLAMLCRAWAAHDGPAAYSAARDLAVTDGEFPALLATITAWARHDATAALEALRAARATDLANDEMAAFMQGWASANPAAAEAFLAGAAGSAVTGEGEVPAAVQRGYEAIARAHLDADPAAAMDWYGRLRAPLQERLRQSVLLKLTAIDPPRASDWLARDAAAQLGASDLVPLLRGLKLQGFDEQFGWANRVANPVTRESALAAIVREGAHAQLVPLGEWLAARADDAALAPAFSAYALQVVKKSPDAAVTWAMSLDQPELRQSALHAVAAEWNSLNPRAAREWAQRTKLVDWDLIAR